MGKILITSGPTREYLDPVRFLTNGSSGRMGAAMAEEVLQRGDIPIIVSGPVALPYPTEAEVHWVETTEQMLQCCLALFPQCVGVIGVAAPCDFKPLFYSEQKIKKSKEGEKLALQFSETPDILAALGKIKRPDQWSVAFALETQDGVVKALEKMKAKNSDFVVLNDPIAIDSETGVFRIFDKSGKLQKEFSGTKQAFATELQRMVNQ